jgi:hypothetical protein
MEVRKIATPKVGGVGKQMPTNTFNSNSNSNTNTNINRSSAITTSTTTGFTRASSMYVPTTTTTASAYGSDINDDDLDAIVAEAEAASTAADRSVEDLLTPLHYHNATTAATVVAPVTVTSSSSSSSVALSNESKLDKEIEEKASALLHRYWGFDTFRTGQLELIKVCYLSYSLIHHNGHNNTGGQ